MTSALKFPRTGLEYHKRGLSLSGNLSKSKVACERKCETFKVRAQSENPEYTSGNLTEKEARNLLGVRESSTFEEIVKAKNNLLLTTDKSKIVEIEAAYDFLLMKSMSKRITGEQPIPASVRFADVKRSASKRESYFNAKNVRKPMTVPKFNFSVPSTNIMMTNTIAFTPLIGWILLQGLSAPPPPGDTLPSFQVALAFTWCIYSLREFKNTGLGKAAGYTLGGLLLGAIIGSGIESIIRIDENPLGTFHSPLTVVSEFAILGMWATATFAM